MSGQERALTGREPETGAMGRRLKTWKEIATFLGCDTRTARRWEDTRALPVRRYPNGSRSAVYAYESDLRAWLEQDSIANGNSALGSPASLAVPRQAARRPGLLSWRASAVLGVLSLFILGLWPMLTAQYPKAVRHIPPPRAEALYRDGLYSWQTRTPVGLKRAVDDFTGAIRRDPNYAAAYAQLAICYDLISEYTATPQSVAFPRARAMAERAIRIDPGQAEAHAALAFAQFYWFRDWNAAERAFNAAIALAPANALVRHWHATALLSMGRAKLALPEIEAAQRLDSESTAILADKGLILAAAGEPAAGIALLRQLERTQPLFASPHKYLAMIYKDRGQDRAYLDELAKSAALRNNATDASVAAAAAKGFASGGHLGMLKALLAQEQQLALQGRAPLYDLARTYAELGRQPQALHTLTLSLARHESNALSFPWERDFAPLHKLPEFHALLAESGLNRYAGIGN